MKKLEKDLQVHRILVNLTKSQMAVVDREVAKIRKTDPSYSKSKWFVDGRKKELNHER